MHLNQKTAKLEEDSLTIKRGIVAKMSLENLEYLKSLIKSKIKTLTFELTLYNSTVLRKENF